MEARDRRASVTSNLRSPEPATATVSEATVCKSSVEHAPVLLPSKLELPIRSPAAGACSAPSASRTLAAAKKSRVRGASTCQHEKFFTSSILYALSWIDCGMV